MNPEDRIKAYLNQNRSSLQYATDLNAVIGQVKTFVFYGMSTLPDDQIRKIVVQWATFNAVGLLTSVGTAPSPAPANPGDPPPSSSDFVDAVKKVITTAGAGVTIGTKDKNFNLKVTGPTANLKSGDSGVSLGVSWGGTVKLQAESGPFHFDGEVGSDSWKIELTFPQDGAVPNLDTLPTIFKEGENSVRNIVRAAGQFNNIDDVRKISSQMKPDIAKVQDAVDAVSGIASMPKKGGWTFGFKIGSPDPLAGQQGMPAGYQATVGVTWVF